MAKKILYKVTAYHCPRCGGITEPTKKYCEYCERDLAIRAENHNNQKCRLLVDCGNFVYFDSVSNFEVISTRNCIDVSTVYDDRLVPFYGKTEDKFIIDLAFSERTNELNKLDWSGLHNVRVEHLGADIGYEQRCYLEHSIIDISPLEICRQRISFVGVNEHKISKAIPEEVMDEMRCPNCGAPIRSRYGACDYCSGWSEVEW